MTLILIAVNTLGWLVLQLAIAWGVTKMNARHFASDNRLYMVRRWESGFYRRWLLIRCWKGMLPDGAPWVGGSFRKKHLAGRNTAHLREFALETRRGEAAHWLAFACFPIFFLWNPPWAWIVMAVYAAAANLPCIVVQRYNREAVRLLLMRREG